MSGEQKKTTLLPEVIRKREIDTQTTIMSGDIVRNRLRGGQEWRKWELRKQ